MAATTSVTGRAQAVMSTGRQVVGGYGTSRASHFDVSSFDNHEKMAGKSAQAGANAHTASANGGGPEPQAPGSQNPGGQIDTGGLGTKFFDRMQGHAGGDDGIQNELNASLAPSMGGVVGTPSNPGQRDGQNTGTSGGRTSALRADAREGVQAKFGEMATDAKRKSKDFMENAKNKLEEFFDSDIDGDGSIGARVAGDAGESPRDSATTGTYPYDAQVGPVRVSSPSAQAREMSIA